MADIEQGHPPRLYVFSGAGLSAESGISTFRTGDGIWSRASIDEVCNFMTWRRNRPAVFRFYNERIAESADARPNAAHRLLAQWQDRWGSERVKLVTQNIDDLLEQAGAQAVTHLHGDMISLLCTDCDVRFPKAARVLDPEAACPECGQAGGVKPGVVFFNESAPAYAQLYRMQREMTDDDLFIAIGTAFEVIPPERILPPERCFRHERNFLVDPAPRCKDFFGVVEPRPATVGLTNLSEAVERLMNGA
ncbi:SIR2 family NAD-dependent protein deacylase [Paraburkholderia caballeronis]|uniref:protein acetyllysine N-acetyltransferase n=1 Tax=Paraburkholderia caballeronis TaxID=416943 RepID=A0A1H7W291_9BURK|nr:Sir2 family NAD-dependent protein deacetylase [Paraburkholderia caballeronis]PXW14535.1 NAD-dependent deacetylase [Paraburkholderia caballeronis]PXW92895.1 NAD-dependent deacetylase [Paraburkholderia caballeronis]RAJ86633.1 NAD-dependent deacetylase [Paraburkholderia caballeronis]TDV03406.1 NAD-dependent deacetylase [Paraburkholderia caballeronis]TDV07037.1 NAD-dependent deacetylase [Paraburkholderia caballeronis]